MRRTERKTMKLFFNFSKKIFLVIVDWKSLFLKKKKKEEKKRRKGELIEDQKKRKKKKEEERKRIPNQMEVWLPNSRSPLAHSFSNCCTHTRTLHS